MNVRGTAPLLLYIMKLFITALLDDVQRFTFYSAGADVHLVREAHLPSGWQRTGSFDLNYLQAVNSLKRLKQQDAVITYH